MYLARYQHMTEKSYMSFEEFYSRLRTPPPSQKTKEEILQDVDAIRMMMVRG